MGAWGSGPLDNDGAADFALELADLPVSERWSQVFKRLQAVATADGYVEAPQAEEAVAAAAITAAVSSEYLLPRQEAVLSGLPAPDGPVLDAARAAIDRLQDPTDNEMLELWTEVGPEADFLATLAAIVGALASAEASPSARRAPPARRGMFRRGKTP